MKIFLNGEELDYEVESEVTLGDILDSISKWLHQKGAVIISAKLGDKPIEFSHDQKMREREISAIETLHLECQSGKLLVVETLKELSHYLNRVARLAPQMKESEVTEESVQQLVDGLGWCVDVLKRVEELLQIDYSQIHFENEKFHKKVLKLGDIRDHIREAYSNKNHSALKAVLHDSVAPLCDSVVRAIPLIMEEGKLERTEVAGEIQSEAELKEEIHLLQGRLKEMPELLEEIAVKISLGDTAKGMTEFAAVVSELEAAFTLIDQCRDRMSVPLKTLEVEGKSFDERSENISEVLSELIGAFEQKDRVLIGDLIEYEIAPEIEALAQVLDQIEENFKGACH